jgi:hypothetical protein
LFEARAQPADLQADSSRLLIKMAQSPPVCDKVTTEASPDWSRMEQEHQGPHQKAFKINLDRQRYGTFAEIGAGQEVARWFFRVGGASGTVAKTISAYDMAVSDAIYGTTTRYVSRQRLEAMLEREYGLLLERLDASLGEKVAFFVFANTVCTRGYTNQEYAHGWMGIRFQPRPRHEPSEIVVHMSVRDRDRDREQETYGIAGVNLIYAAAYHSDRPEDLIRTLMDDLTREHIEIDMIRFSGPAFPGLDNRLMALQLVQNGLTELAMFRADGEVAQPGDLIYKKPVLIQRGSFRPMTIPVMEMMESAGRQFAADPEVQGSEPLILREMTLRNLLADGAIDHADFLARVDILSVFGNPVLISNLSRYYQMGEHLARYTRKPIGMVLGIRHLQEIFDERYYTDLDGGILEAFGRLFKAQVRLLLYPSKDDKLGKVITAETVAIPPHLSHLHAYLLENRLVEPIREYNQNSLHMNPRDARSRIQSGDSSWEEMVPPAIVQTIKDKHLFGCRG